MSEQEHWEERYRTGNTPWDVGKPSSELKRRVAEDGIRPGRALELGCGTGTNAVWLAQQGFDVAAVDISSLAIDQARRRAQQAGVNVQFSQADVLQPPAELRGPFAFFFDRGCYHVLRQVDVQGYFQTLARLTEPGTVGVVLAGNAREPHKPGPPTVSEGELRSEWGQLFEVVGLREFRFDPDASGGPAFLGWSCLVQRKP